MRRILALSMLCPGLCHVCCGSVSVAEHTEHSVRIRTGDYLFSYIRDGELPAATVRRLSGNDDAPDSYLATRFVGGADFELLQKGNVTTVRCSDDPDRVNVLLSGRIPWADFDVVVRFPKSSDGLIHYRVDLKVREDKLLTRTGTEWTFYADDGAAVRIELQDLFATYPYLSNTSVYAPFAYYNDPTITQSTIFYYANYTSMNDYYRFLAVEPKDAVSRYGSQGFGYVPPASGCFQLPAGATVTVADSMIYLRPGRGDDLEYCRHFVESYASVYDLIDKPETEFVDWRQVGLNTIASLQEPPCVSNYYGKPLMRSYVNIAESHTGLCTNLMVLTPFQQFNDIFQAGTAFKQRWEQSIEMFYVPEKGTIFNGVRTGDPEAITTHPASTWYYTFNLLQLGKIAQYGKNARIREIFLATMPYAMRFSRSVDYEFPIFADYMTLEVADPRLEGDMPGCYAYTMLIAYELSGDEVYLQEAKKAIEHLVGKGFKVGYEMHITASGIAACGWLYEITGNPHYLDVAYIPLANLLRDTWLWESDLGYAYAYRTFNNLAAQRGCPVVGPIEQNEAWGFLREYYLRAHEGFPAFLKRLVPEYLKQTMASAYYSYPQTLPAEAVHPGPPYAPTDPALWIGLEGIRPGALKSGSIGQAVYMSGGALRYGGFSYQHPRIAGREGEQKDVLVYCEYPLEQCTWDAAAEGLTLRTAGDRQYACRTRIYYGNKKTDLAGYVLDADNARLLTSSGRDALMDYLEFSARGGTSYVLRPGRDAEAVTDDEIKGTPVVLRPIQSTYLPQRKGYIAPGGTHEYTLIFSNPNPAAVDARLTLKLPQGWQSDLDVSRTFPLEAGETRIPLRITANDHGAETAIVKIAAMIDGERRPIVNQVFSMLMPTAGAGNDLSNIDEWKEIAKNVFTREVIVDLDATRFLAVDTTGMAGGCTLFVSDDYSYQIRVISDTTHKGSYLCDLRQMTDWQGVHRFKFLLYCFATEERPVLNRFEMLGSAATTRPSAPNKGNARRVSGDP